MEENEEKLLSHHGKETSISCCFIARYASLIDETITVLINCFVLFDLMVISNFYATWYVVMDESGFI